MRDDPELDIIRKRGFQHEKRYLADLEAAGRSAVEIDLDGSIEDRGDQLRARGRRDHRRDGGRARTSSTRRRSSTGRGAATPTSCLRVDDSERPSVWGPYHYEVADTKLARHVKASAVLQICSYIDQLERIQGVRPEWLHVALGGSARAVERLRVDDYMAYYRSARDRFLATMADETPAAYPAGRDTYPEPVEHCDVCRWAAECVPASPRRRPPQPRRRDLRPAAAGPEARDVATLEALGDLAAPDGPAARGHQRGRPDPRPGAGPHPARGPADRTNRVRAAAARNPARRIDPERGLAIAAAAVAGRPVLRHRG